MILFTQLESIQIGLLVISCQIALVLLMLGRLLLRK